MNIGEVLNGVFDEDVGWRPASGAIKPVHVANGMIRSLQGRYYDLNLLGSFAVWWKPRTRQVDESRTLEALKISAGQQLGALATDKDLFEKMRRFAFGFLAKDRAVFPTAENSSFTLTCGRMVTRDTNDRGLGELGAFLMGEGDGSLRSEIERCIRSDRPADPITALIWPLLVDSEGRKIDNSVKVTSLKRVAAQRHNKQILEELRSAARCLASHERTHGNQLRTLQRAVHFVCLATHAHAQALASAGSLDERPPALMALAGNRKSDIAIASERSLDSIYSKFENWLGTRLGRRIGEGKPLNSVGRGGEKIEIESGDGRKARAVLSSIGIAKKPHGSPDNEDLNTRVQHFLSVKREYVDAEPAEIYGHCLVQCYLDEYESGGPRQFLLGLGRKAGLLYPHFQGGGAKEKRIRPSSAILDVLVRSCAPHGEPIEFNDFLERVWRRFGLVIGGRRSEDWDDVAYLEKHSLAVSIDELGANTDTLIRELVLMGLARSYPDGVTFVGNGHGS